MPYSKLKLAEMTVEGEEHVDLEVIGKRLGVDKRTVERLVEVYAKKLKKNRRRQGRKFLYLWSDILRCAKLHTGVEKENIPSNTIERGCTKQLVKELKAEVNQLREEIARMQQGNVNVQF